MSDTTDSHEPLLDEVFKADARGQAALEHFPDPLTIIDQQRVIRYANTAARALLAAETNEVLKGQLAFSPKKRETHQVKITLNDGKEMVLQIRRVAAEWEGEPAELATMHDVSRYLTAVQHLCKANRLGADLLGKIPLANYAVRLSEPQALLFASPRFEKLLGCPRDVWSGEPTLWRKFIHNDDRERVLEDFARCVAGKEQFVAEYRMVTQEDDIVWVREESHFIDDPQQEAPCLAGILIDISKDKKSEEELSSYRDFLEQQAIVRATELDQANEQLEQETALRKQVEAELAEALAAAPAPEPAPQADTEQFELANEQLRQELDDARNQIASLETVEAAPDGADIEQLRRELDDARRIETELKAGREHLETQARARAQELEAQIETLRAERDEFDRMTVELKAGREHAETQARERADELKQNAETLGNELDALRPKYADLETRIAAQSEETQTQIAEIQKQLDDTRWSEGELRARRDELEAALQMRDDELAQARAQLQEETNRAEETQTQMAETQKQLDDTRWSEGELRACREKLEATLQTRNEELKQARTEVEQIGERAAKAEQLAKYLADAREQSATEAKTKIEQLEGDMKQLRSEIEASKLALKALALTRDKIETEARERTDEMQAVNEKLRHTMSVYKKLGEEWKARRLNLQAQIDERAVEIKQVTEQCRQEGDKRLRAEHALQEGLQRFEDFGKALRADIEKSHAAAPPEVAAAEGDGWN